MTYAEFSTRDSELHIAYVEAIRAADPDRVSSLDGERTKLHRDCSREYAVSDRLSIHVHPRGGKLGVGVIAHRDDLGLYLPEIGQMSAAELRLAADIREVAQQYEDGQIDDLPPSGTWPPP